MRTTTGAVRRTSHTVRRTSRALADGREIIYFDDTPNAPPRTVDDTRDLGERAAAGHVRYDALVGDWVAVAGHRMNRTLLPPRESCPLCPTGRGPHPTEVPDPDYDVVVIENRFPSYAPVAIDDAPDTSPFEHRPALGRTEVVCFTSDHDACFATLAPSRVRTVVDVWADRTARLARHDEVEQVFCFENRGPEIGVTLDHPHGQVYAYPYVPARTRDILRQAQAHHDRTGQLLGRGILDAERADGSRVVTSGLHWTAYVPYAARWPVEVHLAPHRDVPDLVALDDDERDELALLYLDLLGRLDRYHVTADGGPVALPYIAAWHQAPVRTGRDVSRLHLQLASVLRAPGTLKYLAGSESGVGGWVNDARPEAIAARLREVG
ncbi:MAG: galactose-1-phosphate uridylyltransferase [Ornithinibacter sp.]